MIGSGGESRQTPGPDGPPSVLQVDLVNDPSEVRRLAALAGAFWEAHGLSPDHAFKFDLALDEWLTNVLSYGYDDDARHTIAVRLEVARGWAHAVIADDGRPFDPLSVPAPDTGSALEERGIGGLGIHFIREMMDHVAYTRAPGRNTLTLSRRVAV